MRDALISIAFAAGCLLAPIALALSPREGEAVAVIAAPWSPISAAFIVATADGRLLDAANTLVAVGIDAAPDFTPRLYAAGALLVIDAKTAALCLPGFPNQFPMGGRA